MSSESEWLTRKKRIDPLLAAAGWLVAPFEQGKQTATFTRHALTEYPTDNGPADYALFVAGQPLGVVEAKKVTLGPQNVLSQVERYARGMTGVPFDFGGLHVPFLYSTNGEILWFHDVRHPLNASRRIAGFHTPAALQEMLGRDLDADRAWFATPNNHPFLRPYQVEANAAIEQAIAGRKRQMLVAMATGTGKTFTLVNQAYRKSDVRMTGVFLQEGEQVGLIDPETGSEQLDRLENQREFDTADIERNVARLARDLTGKLANDFTATMTLLRNPAFQDLLVNYPRPKRTFVVAYPTEDTVTSEWLVRESGVEYKPADYLAALACFVKENPLPIEAIRILLDRPQDWSTDALAELKQKLAATLQRFTLDNLEKARAARYHNYLVNIISMVKHAAQDGEPMLTAH